MSIFQKLDERKVFRDSIHKNIVIEYEMIWDLINTSEFQRLRRIHQLGGTYMVFSTAEHSRFTHSMGVYEIVRRITSEVEDVKNILNEREILTVLCAGLLHDLGHGPFSHAFEDVFNTDHEAFTSRIILEDTDINKVLTRYDKEFAMEVSSVIEKKHTNKLLIQLISSQIDADRMDYLLRDAYNCGVTYGNFDLERLIRSMIVVDKRLAFKESGVHAIEDYIFARYHMYWQVYLHPTSSSFELLLVKILKRTKDLSLNGYKFKCDISLLLPFLNNEDVSIKQYLDLDESVLNYYFNRLKYEDDEILSHLCLGFMNRYLYKWIDLKDKESALDLINSLEKDEDKKEYYFDIQEVKPKFYNYYGCLSTQSIMVVNKNNEVLELHETSPLVGAIIQSSELKKELKLFYDSKYRERIENGKI